MHPAPYGLPTGRMIKQRSAVLVWLIWPFITLGIYTFVWYYKIHREMAEFHRKPDSPVAGPMLVLLLLSWTIIAPLVSIYRTGERIAYAQRRAGIQDGTCSPVAGLLLMFVLGLGVLYYQIQLNKIPERYGVPEGTEVQLVAA